MGENIYISAQVIDLDTSNQYSFKQKALAVFLLRLN